MLSRLNGAILTSAVALAVAALGAACGADAASPRAAGGEPTAADAAAGARDAGPAPDGGPSVSPDSGPTAPVERAGVLIGGPGPLPGVIAGVTYRAGTFSGTTDAKGAFRYLEGSDITFSIAGVELATVLAKPKLSPFALAGGPCSVTAALQRVLVTLDTLDDDENPSTGITLPALPAPAGEARKLASMDELTFGAWIGGLTSRPIANGDAATRRFVLAIEDEAWAKTEETTFDAAASAVRSQGVAFDGTGYLFSWRLGLQRTDKALAVTGNKPSAIPLDMLLAGSNHIGDIDVFAGTLYAPVEDGSAYATPTVVLFDAQSLAEKGQRFALPTSLLTKGVPWIAVDGPKGLAYVAEWDPTPSLFVFDLATFNHKKTIPLSQTLGRIQGAKVLEGALYAASDDSEKTVYKIHLDTGLVLPAVFSYGSAVVKEMEGLAVVPGVPGAPGASPALRVLGVDASGSSVTFRTHARTRAPVRAEVCEP